MNTQYRNSCGNFLFRMYSLVNSALLRGDIESARHDLKDLLNIHKRDEIKQSPVMRRLLRAAGMCEYLDDSSSVEEVNYNSTSGDFSKKAEPFTKKELEEQYRLFILGGEMPENSLFLMDITGPYGHYYMLKVIADEAQMIRKRLEEILMELKKGK